MNRDDLLFDSFDLMAWDKDVLDKILDLKKQLGMILLRIAKMMIVLKVMGTGSQKIVLRQEKNI